MTQKFGFDKLIEQSLSHVTSHMNMVVQVMSTRANIAQTPIENLFECSMYFHMSHVQQEWFREFWVATGDESLANLLGRPDARKLIIARRQFQLTDWRVDFLIYAYADWAREPSGGVEGRRKLIVECDGHDFHERTKEQAAKDRARDRWAQSNGYEVFRFTGSELWRDPLGCADQVVQWANRGV